MKRVEKGYCNHSQVSLNNKSLDLPYEFRSSYMKEKHRYVNSVLREGLYLTAWAVHYVNC